MKRRDRDHETLEPHSDVNEDRNHKHHWNRATESFEPEELRNHNVARNHDPVRPPVRTKRAVCERVDFVWVTRIPSDEELRSVGITNQETGRHDDLVHDFHVIDRDVVFELREADTNQRQERHNHPETREDRTRNEVRWEDRRVPTWKHRNREVERDDRSTIL